MSQMTVEQLNELVSHLFDLREDKEEAEAELSGINDEIKQAEGKILEVLTELELDNFKGTRGTVTQVTKQAYKIPATPEEKVQFFDYLKSQGVFDGMISVNYNTLNSWAEKEVEAAKERGDMFFTIPGLGAPTVNKILQKRGKK
jgi:hypothetical protein